MSLRCTNEKLLFVIAFNDDADEKDDDGDDDDVGGRSVALATWH